MSSLVDATTPDEASAKSTVDQLPSLQQVTLIRFIMDLSELDGGCGSEKYRRYGEDEGNGKEEMKQSSVGVIYRRWIVREWDGKYYVRNIDLRNKQWAFGDSSSRP